MSLGEIFMSANHIAAQGGGFEPQRRNNGALYITGLEPYGNVPESGVGVVSLSLHMASFPTTQLDLIELPFLNQSRRVAGRANVEGMDVQVTDYVDKPTLNILLNWHLAVYDPLTGRVGLARDYKKTAQYVLFGPSGGVSRSWTIEGIFPTHVNPGQLDMSDNSQNIVDVQLSVDRVIPNPGGWTAGIIRSLAAPGGLFNANTLSGIAGAAAATIGR